MKQKQTAVAPFYAVAVLWLAAACVLPLYAPLHYVLLAAVSAGVYAGVSALCREEKVKQTAQKAEKPKEESTGNEELDRVLKDGRLAISEMKRLDEAIADAGISADIVRLEQVSEKIFETVKQNPGKLSQLRRFMDYYLPTTLKLLNSYDRMSGTGVSGENIDPTLSKVELMMHTIVKAFEKQLDSLYGAEALDISADITVLETMLAREGLSEAKEKPKTWPPEDPEIKLEL